MTSRPETRPVMRWKDKDAWIRSAQPTHEPLVAEDHFGRSPAEWPAARYPRAAARATIQTRTNCVECSAAGSAGRQCRARSGSPGARTALGVCLYGASRQQPRATARAETSANGVRPGGTIVAPIDEWIASWPPPGTRRRSGPDRGNARRPPPAPAERHPAKIARLIAAIEAGVDPAVSPRSSRLRQAREGSHRTADRRDEVGAWDVPGGRSRRWRANWRAREDPGAGWAEERLDVYESLRIKMVSEPAERPVKAQLQTPTNDAWGFERVRGGT